VARMGDKTNPYRILVGRPERKIPLGKLRRRCEDNIKMDLQEVGLGAWTGLLGFRIGTDGGCECGNEPSCSIKFEEILD